MQAEILGFVGFTQQEKDVLSPREAATITEYLRALLSGATSDITQFSTDLQAHLADYNDPHKVGKSASFLESVYVALYGYYTEMTADPMTYVAFKDMATTPVWFDFVRRLIADYNLYSVTKGITGSVSLPVGLDAAQADPLSTSTSVTATGITSVDDFLTKKGGLTGWDTFSAGDGLGTNVNLLRPKFYVRRDIPLIVTGTDPFSDFQSVTNVSCNSDPLPVVIGLRLGVGKKPTDGMTDILSLLIDDQTITVSYDPVTQMLEVKTSEASLPNTTPVSVPTGIVWVEISSTQITVYTQTTQGVTSAVTALPVVLSSVKSLSVLQPTTIRGDQINIIALAVFTGISDTASLCSQTAYL